MEDYLRYGLLILAALILFLILLEARLRQRRLKNAEIGISKSQVKAEPRIMDAEDRCAIHLPKMAQTDEAFSSLADTSQASSQIPPSTSTATLVSPTAIKQDHFIAISVFSKPNAHFVSYDLLQSIYATGLEFGEMNIFHYYFKTEHGRTTLFSLASATKPGDFNLDRMGDFSCKGLTLFMDLDSVLDPGFAFNKMLATAEQLADDLDGDLYAAPRIRLTPEILQSYRQRIAQMQK